MSDNGHVDRILVVVAHPDDADFGCAGSIATWTREGSEVAYCIVTDGTAGGRDSGIPPADLKVIREAEQRAAGAVLGVEDITFLGYPDGALMVNMEVRRDISRVIRRFRPQRVVAQSPVRNWVRVRASHPDHLAAGEAALCAVYPDARNPYAHPELLEEGLQPHTVSEVWITGMPEPDRFVDVTDAFSSKVAALRCHKSQVSDMDGLENMLRTWLVAGAQAAGLPEGRLVESFRAMATG